MNTFRLFIIFLTVLSFTRPAISSAASVKESLEENYYPLSKLKTITPQQGMVYTTEGYVVMMDECPPCPVEAVCAPCPPDYIVISPNKKLISYPDQIGPNDLQVNLNGPVDLKLGKKYRFKLQLAVLMSWDGGKDFEVVEAQIINRKKAK